MKYNSAMNFEHLIQINDPENPLAPPLTREQLWQGLSHRIENPVPFLPGESLWRQPGEARPVAACARDVPGQARPSAACRTFLDGSERARQQWALEADFERFEREPDWGMLVYSR